MTDDSDDALPEHVESTVDAIRELRQEGRRRTSPYQRAINRLTGRFGTPAFLATITVFIIAWIVANLALPALGKHSFDAPPFYMLQGTVSTTALYVTVLILTAQRHETDLAERRAQLTLQIALISERKLAKLIERAEQHRRDDPHVETDHDQEAADMSKPVDAGAVASAIRNVQAEVDKI